MLNKKEVYNKLFSTVFDHTYKQLIKQFPAKVDSFQVMQAVVNSLYSKNVAIVSGISEQHLLEQHKVLQ